MHGSRRRGGTRARRHRSQVGRSERLSFSADTRNGTSSSGDNDHDLRGNVDGSFRHNARTVLQARLSLLRHSVLVHILAGQEFLEQPYLSVRYSGDALVGNRSESILVSSKLIFTTNRSSNPNSLCIINFLFFSPQRTGRKTIEAEGRERPALELLHREVSILRSLLPRRSEEIEQRMA